MSNLRKKMVMNLKYGGITKEEYEELQDEILEKFGDAGDYDTLPVATLYEDPNDVE